MKESRAEEGQLPTAIDHQGVPPLLAARAQLVDVLAIEEHEAEHIPGVISTPLKDLNLGDDNDQGDVVERIAKV